MTIALYWGIVLNEDEKKQAIALLPFKKKISHSL
jgi:hypothetical protein